MDASQDFKALRDAVQAALVTVTRSVNGIANEDLQFQRTVHPSVAIRLDQNTEHLLQLASGVLKSAAKLTAQRETPLEDVDDVEIQWRGIVDVVDSLLEKSDTCLDEYTGLIKRKDAPTPETVRERHCPLQRHFTDGFPGPRCQTAKIDPRPTRLVPEARQHSKATKRLREEGGQLRIWALEALVDRQASCSTPCGAESNNVRG